MIDREHVDRERAFQRGVLVKIVDDDLRDCASRFSSMTTRVFSSDSSRMAVMSPRTFSFTSSAMRSTSVARFTLYGISVMTICSRPPLISSTPALPRTFMLPRPVSRYCRTPLMPQMAQPVGKSGPFTCFINSVERDVRVIDLRANAIDHFAQIVRRHVGRHADGDAGAAVDEQIRKGGRENRRLGPRLVVVRDKIDRVLVHVVHERGAEMGHARFGVTHGRRRIAFDRTEIALAIDQAFAHRPRLGHVDERRINHRFAVRMIVTAGVTANLRALTMLPVRERARDRASRRGCGAAKASARRAHPAARGK